MNMALTRVQITQRNRARHKVLKEELAKYAISERRFYVDDVLYGHFATLAGDLGKDVHALLFTAMKAVIKEFSPDVIDYKNHLFFLESAMMDADHRLYKERLGSLREMEAMRELTAQRQAGNENNR